MTSTTKRLLAVLAVLLTATLAVRAQTTAEIHWDFSKHLYNDLEDENPV